MAPGDVNSLRSCSQASTVLVTRNLGGGNTGLQPPSRHTVSNSQDGDLNDVEPNDSLDDSGTRSAACPGGRYNNPDVGATPQDEVSRKVQAPITRSSSDSVAVVHRGEATPMKPKQPFHKWMRSLHKRAAVRPGLGGNAAGMHIKSQWVDGPADCVRKPGHRASSSGSSSFDFVTAVKSASISLASASVIGRSRKNTLQSVRGYTRTDRSSRASASGVRCSEDSCMERFTPVDPVVTERALQRRRVLEELITTEEGYIGDVKFLSNVYVTILASLPTLPRGLRSSINRNLADIVELHEEILGELHRAVPDSEYTQLDLPVAMTTSGYQAHQRWRSLNAVPEDTDGISWLRNIPGMTVDSQVAAEAAKIFTKKMNRFFIYEEYGAKYEMMIKDVTSAHRTMPQWALYQRGLETLASSIGSANSHTDSPKKSLTIGDLLVKPIQRVCKYPLLFSELLKYTPVCDCPHSHMEIENTLFRLREATAEINRATDNSLMKATLEKSWLLQDRLVFPDQKLDAVSKSRIRSFGHIQLCGALHVCWQTKESVAGLYMICLLYRDYLCMATAGRVDQIYTIKACIALAYIRVEEADNGRGLQCHTAPFSWKLVFECDNQLYEIVMTACNAREESEWRNRLGRLNRGAMTDHDGAAAFSFLSLNIKALGTVFRKPGTMARRISIHRATTVGPKSPLCQVVLKNTCVSKDMSNIPPGLSAINRSQSLLTTTHRIPILAPHRGERARLEALLSDVWTREVLPFPGMTHRTRSENLVRTSASSMIRKLSVASITSAFTKRSGSFSSSHRARGDEEQHSNGNERTRAPGRHCEEIKITERSCETDEAGASRLSTIHDEQEKAGSVPGQPSTRSMPELGKRLLEGETYIIQDEVVRESIDSARSLGTTVLVNASNNRQISRVASPASRRSLPDKDIRTRISERGPRAKLVVRKSSGKWTRSGILHRGVVVQGIRNLFR